MVAIKEGSRSSSKFASISESNGSRPLPKWLEKDAEGVNGKVVAVPTREDIDLEVDETLIVELYSK